MLLRCAHLLSSATFSICAATWPNNRIDGRQADAATSSIANLGGDLEFTSATYVSLTTTHSQPTTRPPRLNSYSATSKSNTSTLSVSLLQGTVVTNATSTTTSSSVPSNTQACNNHPEFCQRQYSNITFVAAHNSPFIMPNNAAANQDLPVLTQLNDGVRMLQGQTHYNATSETISYCHTSCNLLNASTAQEFFEIVENWVSAHPYDVITLLIGNSDFIGVGNYTTPLEDSGLAKWAYVPPQVPMNISSWPTLATMIFAQQRVVIFMDYNANQSEVPYILDEFSHMWETPFSPTDRSFPCTVQRPPGLVNDAALQRLYMANHNLNTQITLLGQALLVPTLPLINETNAVSGNGSLGAMAERCTTQWSRPPNFLLVDYYNDGNFPGSVFEVAAQLNNVTRTRPCCGIPVSPGARIAALQHRQAIIGMSLILGYFFLA